MCMDADKKHTSNKGLRFIVKKKKKNFRERERERERENFFVEWERTFWERSFEK